MTPEELKAKVSQLRSGNVQPTQPVQTPDTQMQTPVEQPAPTPVQQEDSWLTPDPFLSGNSDSSFNITSDPYLNGGSFESQSSSAEPVATELSDKKELSAEDIVNLPFEEIVKLADVNSPLEYSAKRQIADALNGNLPGTAVGRLVGGADEDEMEFFTTVLGKQREFQETEDSPGQLQRLKNSVLFGDQYSGEFGDNQSAVIPWSQAAGLSTANAALGEYGDELVGLVSERGQRAIRGANRQLQDNDVPFDAFLTDMLGAAVPAGAAARGIGVGAQGVGALGNIGRSALLGAAEGGISASGANDAAESIEDRIASGLGGAVIGGALGGAVPTAAYIGRGALGRIKSFVSSSSREAKAARNTINQISTRVSRLKTGNSITADEILDGLDSGIPIQQQLLSKGLNEQQTAEIINDLSDGSRRIMDNLNSISNDLTSSRATALDNSVSQTGQALERARLDPATGVTPDGTARIISDTARMPQGAIFQDDILMPSIRNVVRRNTNLARRAGYGTDADLAARNIHIDPASGKMFIIKRKAGRIATPNSKTGNYRASDLYEVIPDGQFVRELQSESAQLTVPNVRQGAPVNQVQGFEAFEPITRRLGLAEGRVSPSTRTASRDNALARRRAEAWAEGRKGSQSTVNYVTDLYESTVGPTANMSKAQKDSLAFLAKEANTLRKLGREVSTNPVHSQAAGGALGDARVAGMFASSPAGILRITGINWLLRTVRSKGNFGSATQMSASERALMPAIEALVRADDQIMNTVLREAVEQGVKSGEEFARRIGTVVPAFGAALSTVNAASHVTGDQQNLLGEID